MRKQVLVSVDRGETRVAILESKKAAGRGGQQTQALEGRSEGRRGLAGRRALHRAPRPPFDRRQHLQGPRRQRARRHGGRVRRHRPREERLPPRRRDRHARRRDPAPRTRPGPRRAADLRPAEGGPGDRRAGHQGPDRDEGRAPLDGGLDPRPLPRLRAGRRRCRRIAPAARQGARAAAQARLRAEAEEGGADHPHRGASAPARATWSASCSTCSASTRCCRAGSTSHALRRWSSRRRTCRSASCATCTRRSSSAP